MAGEGGNVTTKTWSVDVVAKKVYYSQIRNGYGPLDGAKMFVGDVTGSCD